jgi:signal transduction histidine kinase
MAAHTILVVDDEPASVRAVARALNDEHRVTTATTGAEGLAVLAAEPVALMIVDQRMPGMSGTELLAQCAGQQPDVIRVLLTGYTDIETLLDAINAGHVYYYLTKPWEPQELRLVVRRGLERYDVEADRRRLLRELERAFARVRREADQKGRLLALTAHELGTPLHVLSNALDLRAVTDLPAPARPWFETAQRNAAWLSRAVAQMVAGARWRGGGLKLDCRPCDVASLLRRVHAAFQPVAAARRLALRVDAGRCPPLLGDRIWLEQALTNLVSNAVRFTPDGGTITVEATANDAAVVVKVTDTGIGIDEGALEEVFEPFSGACGDVVLHASGRFEFGSRGLGLGLAITKAIVDRHGGSIAVRSQKGAGSQFTITLPLRPAADAPRG